MTRTCCAESGKVAILCFSLNPDLRRYFEVKLDSLPTRLGESVVFVGHSERDRDSNVVPFARSRRAFLDPRALVDVLRAPLLVRRLARDGVTTLLFDTAHLVNVAIAVVARALGMRLVFTIHDWEPHPGFKATFVRLYNWFAERNADRFVMFSTPDPKPRVRIHTLPLAGVVDVPQPVPEVPKGTAADPVRWLFFGRIDSYKGVEFLPEISDWLLRWRPGDQLVVAGAGDHLALSELRRRPNVRLLNRFVSEQEVDELFRECSAVLLPYTSATQSGVIPLSYAYRRPVVAFDVGYLGTYIRDGVTGFLVPPGSVSAFCATMQRAVESGLAALGGACGSVYEAEYSSRSAAENYAAVVESLLGFDVPESASSFGRNQDGGDRV